MNIIKKIWIVGSEGQLGRALNQLIDPSAITILNTDYQDVDITDSSEVMNYAKQNQPDVIINCAAFTAVDLCEKEVDKAYKINALGARNLAVAAQDIDAKIVHVSTDYVFSGDKYQPYTEFDQVLPQSVYGKTKLAGENFVKEFSSKHFIVRTAWLYGDGNNFVRTMLRLAKNSDTVRVVKDQIGTPTSAKELARMIIYLMDTTQYGLYHGTCEGVCTWYDFAVEIFRQAQITVDLVAITTSEYPTPAKRPAYSVLDNYMLRLSDIYKMADWELALEEYMKEEGLFNIE